MGQISVIFWPQKTGPKNLPNLKSRDVDFVPHPDFHRIWVAPVSCGWAWGWVGVPGGSQGCPCGILVGWLGICKAIWAVLIGFAFLGPFLDFLGVLRIFWIFLGAKNFEILRNFWCEFFRVRVFLFYLVRILGKFHFRSFSFIFCFFCSKIREIREILHVFYAPEKTCEVPLHM